MPSLDLQQFGGIAPKISERKLPDGAAVTANNVRLESGDLAPLKTHTDISAELRAGVVKSIYQYGNDWFSWTTDVDAIGSPIARDVYDRVYYTGDGVPKVTSNLIATGVGADPQFAYDLGVPAPTVAPNIVTITGEDPDPENFSDDETRFYVYTYVTEYGEEGPPSPVSAVANVLSPDQTVTVGTSNPVSNTQNITAKRIYRTSTSGSFTGFFLVKEIIKNFS